MATFEDRIFLFWFFCIPLRAIIAAAITVASIMHIYEINIVFSIYAIYVGAGLLMKFVFNCLHQLTRLPARVDNALIQFFVLSNEKGNFGGPVWWQLPRIVHAILLLCYAGFALSKYEFAYIFALVDVGIAVCFWFVYFCSRIRESS